MTAYFAATIDLGTTGPRRVNADRLRLHEDLVGLLDGGACRRTGDSRSFALSTNQIHYEPDLLARYISKKLQRTDSDLLIADFLLASYRLLREPILIHLAAAIERGLEEGRLRSCLLVLPVLPDEHAASRVRWNSLSATHPQALLCMASPQANDCNGLVAHDSKAITSLIADYLKDLTEDPVKRLTRRLVRRLGRYQQQARDSRRSRLYSYVVDRCEAEIVEIMESWWKLKGRPGAFLYATGSMPEVSRGLKAFAVANSILSFQVDDLLQQQDLQRHASSAGIALPLVVDVVQSGRTLESLRSQLEAKGIGIDMPVLSILSKRGVSMKSFCRNGTQVESILAVDSDPIEPARVQDELGLAFTSDKPGLPKKIRAFDMWFMATQVGWESEPEAEVPEWGPPYLALPRFPEIVENFGDWIAYLIEKGIRDRFSPEDLFVIHPDEPGANAISERLYLRFPEGLSVLRIPKTAIHSARRSGWSTTLGSARSREEEWTGQLDKQQGGCAIITDIFNASGGTFQTLKSLVEHYEWTLICYFPLVDRHCGPEASKLYEGTEKLSLYDWYGPRKSGDGSA